MKIQLNIVLQHPQEYRNISILQRRATRPKRGTTNVWRRGDDTRIINHQTPAHLIKPNVYPFISASKVVSCIVLVTSFVL